MDFDSLEKQAKEYISHGQSREAINLLESQLSVHNQENESEDYKKTMSELCDIYNDLASELLSTGDTAGALGLIRKAESINVGPSCKVKTLNTLACYYRQINKVRIAESYLLKALTLQPEYPNTHLNLCAVLSELGKHEDAMMQAMQAVILMQDLIISFKKNPTIQIDDSFMPIAYLNLGVQLEFLKRFTEALGFYQRAEIFSEKKLHPEHPVRKNAEHAVKEIKKKIDEKNAGTRAKTLKPKAEESKAKVGEGGLGGLTENAKTVKRVEPNRSKKVLEKGKKAGAKAGDEQGKKGNRDGKDVKDGKGREVKESGRGKNEQEKKVIVENIASFEEEKDDEKASKDEASLKSGKKQLDESAHGEANKNKEEDILKPTLPNEKASDSVPIADSSNSKQIISEPNDLNEEISN